MGLLNNKLFFTADYFIRQNDEMLMDVTPASYYGYMVRSGSETQEGGESSPTLNIGKLENRGFEFTASWKDNVGKLGYSINVNFTYIKTKAVKIDPDTIPAGQTKGVVGTLTKTISGQSIGEYYGLQTNGLFSMADVATDGNGDPILDEDGNYLVVNQPYIVDGEGNREYAQPNAQPGDFRFVDLNGDGILDGDDFGPIGNPNPKYIYGLNLDFEYGWFDLSIFLQGVGGNKIFNSIKYYLYSFDGQFNWAVDYEDNHYREEIRDDDGNILFPANYNAEYPRIDPRNSNQNLSRMSDFYMESGAYLRLKNLQLGMTLPREWTSKAGIERCRFYVSGKNLITITKYTGFDPEVGSNIDPDASSNTNNLLVQGLDKGAYPPARMFSVGLNVTF
ncbi:TonB-dependent receptor P3 [subsurface metagenome]